MKQSVSTLLVDPTFDPTAHDVVDALDMSKVPIMHWLAGAVLQNAVTLALPADTASPAQRTMLPFDVRQIAYSLALSDATVDIPTDPTTGVKL